MSWSKSLVRAFAAAVVALALGMAAPMAQSTAQPPRAAQDEFVPIDQLPPDERLPAARFLIAAYAVAWMAIAVYLWSIWQRLGRVERELAEAARRTAAEAGTPRRREGAS